MTFYPEAYLNSILDITFEFLQQNEIQGLILDVDNTLIDLDRNMLPGTKEWIDRLKENKIRFCILSNSNKKKKVQKVAEDLEIPYFYFGKKPFKGGFQKAAQVMKLENENIGVVGDQILTDIIGARRCKMYPILVKPINQKDIFITKVKRPFEKMIIDRYQKKKESKKS